MIKSARMAMPDVARKPQAFCSVDSASQSRENSKRENNYKNLERASRYVEPILSFLLDRNRSRITLGKQQ